MKPALGIRKVWVQTKNSFWFVPSVLIVCGIVLAVLLPLVDRRFLANYEAKAFFLFGGNASAARELLSVIATSLTTVVSVSFSITILALQQASTQYSPRVLKSFARDRANQIVLGSYIATVLFSLLVLREVRDEGPNTASFVPALSVMMALLLTVISFGMLIYFLHHISRTLQVSAILRMIRSELNAEVLSVYPDPLMASEPCLEYEEALAITAPLRRQVHTILLAHAEGYLRQIDHKRLKELTSESRIHFVLGSRQSGDYLVPQSEILHIWSDSALDEAVTAELVACFAIESERNVTQDPLYGIRQICDIALRALSPGVNDPTTAEECLYSLKGVLALLLKQRIPSCLERIEGTSYVFRVPGFSDFVVASLKQIQAAAKDQDHVKCTIREIVAELAEIAPPGQRERVLREWLALNH